MQERIPQRLAERKQVQTSVEQELTQIEPRRAYLVQELLKLSGAVQALAGLVPADVQERACHADGVVVE